jgi:hypothetical protein
MDSLASRRIGHGGGVQIVAHGGWFAICSILGQSGTPKSAWYARRVDQLALLVAFDDCVRKVGLGGVQVCPGEAPRAI